MGGNLFPASGAGLELGDDSDESDDDCFVRGGDGRPWSGGAIEWRNCALEARFQREQLDGRVAVSGVDYHARDSPVISRLYSLGLGWTPR